MKQDTLAPGDIWNSFDMAVRDPAVRTMLAEDGITKALLRNWTGQTGDRQAEIAAKVLPYARHHRE